MNIIIGVTGGIACFKAVEVVTSLVEKGHCVHVIMTKNAQEFVTPLTFQTLSRNLVITDMFEKAASWNVRHISLAQQADVFAVVPATANVIGKIASGIADDMLTTTIMAARCRKVIAPAMNTAMWENPVVQDNIKKLGAYGYEILDTDSGMLACGAVGMGKLLGWEKIVEAILKGQERA
ncbi:Coenzyme A biosynthesis bifunctional protein CoaBC [bioreactor metagenome]|uniref:Coenzyme A biosynthesis bifunctional protein CoaBC n=1 Tax=bioreactor metagenome TaxID=1076179 RepID=A0A644X2P8_9ZZZZ